MSVQFRQAVEALKAGDLDRARALAESEIAAAPSPQAHHLLGIVHCRLGDVATGVEHLRAAADAEPGNAGFRIMLMRALVDAGRPLEVLAMPEPPAIRSAAELEQWRARAEAADAAADIRASASAWSKVAAAVTGDWRAWANLGNSYAANGEWQQAADALSKAVALNPSEAMVQRNAGAALLQANRAEEAISAFEAARRLGDGSFAVELGLGQSYVAQRRFAEAERALERAYALEPGNRDAVFRYGLALDRNNKTQELATLLDDAVANGIEKRKLNYLFAVLARRRGQLQEAHDLLLKSDPDADDPIAWHHLRAKLADALGRPAEAFAAAAAMNEAALEASVAPEEREEWQRETAAYRQEQHELARAITPKWAARIPVFPEPPPRKLSFLVGFPRSGTTLLDTFLMGHPQLAVLEEEQLVGKASRGLKVQDLPDKSLAWVTEARALYLRLMSQLTGASKAMVVDKFPLDMAAAPLIHSMFPGAPIIFMQRHPCDVVLSGFMQAFGLANFNSLEAAADYYDAMMSVWTSSKDALPLNTHTVVYEELVEDPQATLRPLVDFLGIGWDDRIMDHQATARGRGTIATPSYDQVTEPISRAPRGRWKQYRDQLKPVLPLLLGWAERLGYQD